MNAPTDVVLLHGWGQHGGVWEELAHRLPGHLRPLAFDLPGHGHAPWQPPGFELDALVDKLAELAPAHCHVVAWSLGAMLALRWAQRYPTQVGKLVLIAATPCFGTRDDWPHGTSTEVQQAFAERVAADPVRGLQGFSELMAEGDRDARALRRTLRKLLDAAPTPLPEALAAGLQFLAETDLRADLLARPPQQPTLLIHGEDDTITPIAASRWLARILRARELALAHCGHAPMLSHVDEVDTAIAHFLAD